MWNEKEPRRAGSGDRTKCVFAFASQGPVGAAETDPALAHLVARVVDSGKAGRRVAGAGELVERLFRSHCAADGCVSRPQPVGLAFSWRPTLEQHMGEIA